MGKKKQTEAEKEFVKKEKVINILLEKGEIMLDKTFDRRRL